MTDIPIAPSSQIGADVQVDPGAHIGPNCHLKGQITVEVGPVLVGGITLIGDSHIGRDARLEPGVCIAAPRPGAAAIQPTVRVGQQFHIGAGITFVLPSVALRLRVSMKRQQRKLARWSGAAAA